MNRTRLRLLTLLAGASVLLQTGCQRPEPLASSARERHEGGSSEVLAADGKMVVSTPGEEPKSGGEVIVLESSGLDGLSQSGSDSASASQTINSSIAVEASSEGSDSSISVDSLIPPTQSVVSRGMQVTDDELNQVIAADWPKPQVVFYVSGQQQGYIEPCGCTGLESQKGGLIRRDTLLTSLRDRGWNVVPMDVGNQVRRRGRQPQIKFETTVDALQQMGYQAVSLGLNDLKLRTVELVQAAGSVGSTQRPFVIANVKAMLPDIFPSFKIVEIGGRKIGITAVLGEAAKHEIDNADIEISDPIEKLKDVVPHLQEEGCDFIVLLAHASLRESADIAAAVPGIDLVVTAGGFGEPTRDPEPIESSKAVMVQVGTKGMYGGIVGLFDDPDHPIRYQRLAISSQFEDSHRMLELFARYQDNLKEEGFRGLGLHPARHGSGREFVGSDACGDCHTTAYEIWKNSPHAHATDDIVAPNNDRGGIARHFDPECISCHVTGWNPQEFTPYETGYLDLEKSQHLVGSGCENCHGPGSAHVAAENGDIETTPELLKQLRQELILPLAKAPEKCVECHDLDNSPAFHEEGAFEKFWEQVKHYGKD